MPEKISEATTLTWPSPPRKRPTSGDAELQQPVGNRARVHDVCAATMNSGTASRMKLW
jgi:hypothetical protein